jgi:hypothetical protein
MDKKGGIYLYIYIWFYIVFLGGDVSILFRLILKQDLVLFLFSLESVL